jgi:2-(1,2-epoxy-1,2-dihydrophenyl)acetyl-CoA isomerase
MEFIKYKTNLSVAWIHLNRPAIFNSIHRGLAMELLHCLEEINNNDELRCVVISGEGKAFSAGQDLQEVMDPEGPGLERILSEHYAPLVKKVRSLEKPVIAAVNGIAAGAAANLALCCDIVVAKQSAAFIQAFSKIGLIPDTAGTYILPRLIGWNKASALMMTGDKISASEALQAGMIYKVFADDTFEEDVQTLANAVAAMPTKALAMTKKLLNLSFTNTLDQQLDAELRYQIEAGNTDDYQEGIHAFIQKRAAIFKGN